MRLQLHTTIPVPPGFKVHPDPNNEPYPTLTFRHAYTWLGSWKPFMNGIGVREPIIVPDTAVHDYIDDVGYIPTIPHKDPQADAEVYIDCQNSHVIGVTMMWVPVNRLTVHGMSIVDTFPMRIPLIHEDDD